jgi:hypothetical protein
MILTEMVSKFGNGDKKHDLGNGFELITRHVIYMQVGTPKFCVEYELYKDSTRLFDIGMLESEDFPEDQEHKYENILLDEEGYPFGGMISAEEGKIQKVDKLIPKMIWYAIGDTYAVKDKLKSAGMQWEPTLKAWEKLEKPLIDGVEFVQIKTYKTVNQWTWNK